MTRIPRTFPDYASALRNAYEEEISGISYFEALAETHGGAPATALRVMAEMERATARALLPLLAEAGIEPRADAVLAREGRRDADAQRDLGWTALLTEMRDDYGAYVTEFHDLLRQTPGSLRARIDLLIDHEVALIAFARAELDGDENSLAVLRDYLDRAALF